MNELVKISEDLAKIDVTKLVYYSKRVMDINQALDPGNSSLLIRDFIIAYDIANNLYASAIKSDMRADSALKQAESIAYLDRAGEYLKSRDIKDSSAAREKYVPIDPDVLTAKELKAKTAAISKFLANKLQEFRSSHESVRKIAYSQTYQSGFEGQ